jgi:hypothetical protein
MKISAVYSENNRAHTNTLCRQNIVFLNVCVGDTYSNYWVLRGYFESRVWNSRDYAGSDLR